MIMHLSERNGTRPSRKRKMEGHAPSWPPESLIYSLRFSTYYNYLGDEDDEADEDENSFIVYILWSQLHSFLMVKVLLAGPFKL